MPDALETLSERDRRLVRLALAVQLGRFDELARLRRAAPAGEPDRAWREALLQAHLFAGVPRVVEAWSVLLEHGGLGAPEPGELDEPAAGAGERAFGAVYGARAPAVRERLGACHPLLERWVLAHAYGRVLARGGLDLARRELLAVVALAALEQERQLAAHLRGALAAGARAGALRAAAEAADALLAPRARELLARALRRELDG